MDAQSLADFIAGVGGAEITKTLIAKMNQLKVDCGSNEDGKCDEVVALLKQGYHNWEGEELTP
jgi:hypothetical protein